MGKKFRDFIAFLIYDKEWEWVRTAISILADLEMFFERFMIRCFKFETFNNCGKIPCGMYCYDNHTVCPYLSFSRVAEFFYGKQMCGYCHFLKGGDYNGGTDLLWDMCKECDINDAADEYTRTY